MRLGYRPRLNVGYEGQDASMRPRRMRLGYPKRRLTRSPTSSGFNEAEAHAPRILLAVYSDVAKTVKASMRPRRMRLGYQTAGVFQSAALVGLQ